jgi:pheromone shutdown protein TraB
MEGWAYICRFKAIWNGGFCSGSSFQSAVGRSLQLGGQSALLLRLLLSRQAGKLSEKFGMDIGADMRAAREAAESVGAELVLGRHTSISTLKGLSGSCSAKTGLS